MCRVYRCKKNILLAIGRDPLDLKAKSQASAFWGNLLWVFNHVQPQQMTERERNIVVHHSVIWTGV